MEIKNVNVYGGTIQDIHDNTIYVNSGQPMIVTPSQESTIEDVEVVETIDNDIIEKGMPYFNLAIGAGLMKQTANGYEWIESQVLLAYFCGKIYCGDYVKVGKMDFTWKAGNDAFFPEKALGTLFNRPNIGTSRRKQLEGTPPKGYQKIEQLF
jgi:hypothetical protein